MTTAERLLKVDEGVEKVKALNAELEQTLYGTDTGSSLEANVNQTNADFQAVKNKIIEKGVELTQGTPTAEYAPKIDKVYEAGEAAGLTEGIEQGKKAQYDEFWDRYQDYGNRTDCSNMFSGRGWNDQTFNPKYDIVSKTSNMLFRYCAITDIEKSLKDNGRKIVFSGGLALTFNNMLTEKIGELYFDTPITMLSQTFNYNSRLKEIKSELPVTENTTFDNPFAGCDVLEEVRFSGTIGKNGLNLKWSTKLSKASWISIVNTYSSTVSSLSMTGSLVSVNKAFETSEGANDGSTSEEWLNLIASKPNVTFNLI